MGNISYTSTYSAPFAAVTSRFGFPASPADNASAPLSPNPHRCAQSSTRLLYEDEETTRAFARAAIPGMHNIAAQGEERRHHGWSLYSRKNAGVGIPASPMGHPDTFSCLRETFLLRPSARYRAPAGPNEL
jgi:hypothetical protein